MISKDNIGTAPAPREITLKDAERRQVIGLKPGQDVMIELTRAETLGAKWRFSGVPAPRVTLMATLPPPDPNPNVRVSPHGIRHVERYSWSAQQLKPYGKTFSIEAAYSRNAIEVGRFHFDFCVTDEEG